MNRSSHSILLQFQAILVPAARLRQDHSIIHVSLLDKTTPNASAHANGTVFISDGSLGIAFDTAVLVLTTARTFSLALSMVRISDDGASWLNELRSLKWNNLNFGGNLGLLLLRDGFAYYT